MLGGGSGFRDTPEYVGFYPYRLFGGEPGVSLKLNDVALPDSPLTQKLKISIIKLQLKGMVALSFSESLFVYAEV
jgi:hypothetical protein